MQFGEIAVFLRMLPASLLLSCSVYSSILRMGTIFSSELSDPLHHGSGVYSACNRNEYRKIFWGLSAAAV
jgi:hypothetical protein